MFDLVGKYKKFIMLIIGMIAVSFIGWGIGDKMDPGGRAVVASVNGIDISQREFDEQLRQQQEQIRRLFGGQIDPAALDSAEARQALLDSMIGQRLVASAVARGHLLMSRETVIEAITQAPEFQENGQFSAALYSAHLSRRNVTDQGNVAELQVQLPMQRFVGSIADTAIASRSLAARLAALEAQKREVAELRLSAQQFLPQVKVGEAAIKAHFDANQADYRTPERVRAEYLVLSAENLSREETVTEAELKTAYEARASQFRVEEQRRASHVLVKTREEADRILAEVRKAPGRFAELAKQHSTDAGSAAQGGDLGWFARGMMVKPFEDAAFALKPNETQVVESEFGFHVIRLAGIQAGKARALDEVRKELTAELAKQKGARRFSEAAEAFTNTVYEQSDSLKPAAERFKLQVQTTGWIGKSTRQELGALDNPKLVAALFSSDALTGKRNTDAIEVAPGTLVSARVVEHQPATQRKFEEVKEQIGELLRQREASALALKDGTAKLERLRKGEDAGVRWSPVRTVSRRDAQGLPLEVLRRVVSADVSKLPAYVGVPLPDAGYLLLKISKVIEVSAGEPDAESMVRMTGAIGAAQLDAVVAGLRSRADVSIRSPSPETK